MLRYQTGVIKGEEVEGHGKNEEHKGERAKKEACINSIEISIHDLKFQKLDKKEILWALRFLKTSKFYMSIDDGIRS